jgi:predicted phage terminase large subunit-like protein
VRIIDQEEIVKPIFNAALRKDLYCFVKKAFLEAHGYKLGDQTYVEYICYNLSKIGTERERLFVVNLPPQHLKTFCTSCLIAWYLGQHPKHRVLVIGYTGEHAESISRRVRDTMRSEWYQDAFRTRISPSRSSASNFETTAGGGIYAVSANGSVTGRPADLIVYDDPVQITDCNNLEHLEKVNRQFDSLIMSRLSNPAKGCVVIVAHRLNENDISGHVLKQGGFRHICLPAVAPRKKRFQMGDQTWLRRKGDPLRPDQYPKKVIARLRKSVLIPDFETLYQQNPGGGSSIRIKQEHFHFRDLHRMPEQPIILSVDPGGLGMRSDKSYSVIQLWIPLDAGDHLLWDQFRAQCGLDELWAAFRRFARRTPSAILIENTANGPALIERAKRIGRYRVIPITPDGRSKVERLRRHIRVIRDGHVHLRQGAAWAGEYIGEMSEFPCGPFDDQVDGTTQYLDYISQGPTLTLPPPSGICAGWATRRPLYALPPAMQRDGMALHYFGKKW